MCKQMQMAMFQYNYLQKDVVGQIWPLDSSLLNHGELRLI